MEPLADPPPPESKTEDGRRGGPPLASPARAVVRRAVMLPSIALLLGFAGMNAKTLWHEWGALRVAQHEDVHSRAIGYHDVTPDFSYASPPGKWVRDEGKHSYLWAGWDRQANTHLWFTFPKGEIDARHLSHPMGRDTLRAIDHPRVEMKGSEIWESIPPQNLVVSAEISGLPTAYPVMLLDKVVAINDSVSDQPFLVVYMPFVTDGFAVEIFDARPAGKKRLTMGNSGYLWDRKPLLYDREGESLWVSATPGLLAVAGPLKGTVLNRLARLSPSAWSDWSASYPHGRLVVGAHRPKKVATQ
ncbi:MAG: hypothetical protein JWN86_670 [Planctomycetota bacterium]|nr:hypothetical protein [Planctomycetota bacterium]